MIGPIAHRGPDDSGVWADAQAGSRVRLPPARHHRPVAARPSADVVALGPLRHRVQRRGLQLRRAAPRARGARVPPFAGSPTPRSCSRRSSSGAFARRSPASSACSRSRCGTRAPGAVARARSPRQEAAVRLPRARPGHVRLRAEGADRRTVLRPHDRSRGARGLSPLSVRAGAAEHLRARDQAAGRRTS